MLRNDAYYLVYTLQSFEVDTHLCLDFTAIRPVIDNVATALLRLRDQGGHVIDRNRMGLSMFVDPGSAVLLEQSVLDMGVYTRDEEGAEPILDHLAQAPYAGGFSPAVLYGQDLIETIEFYEESYLWPYSYEVRLSVSVTEQGGDVYVKPEIFTQLPPPYGEQDFGVHTGFTPWNKMLAKIPTSSPSRAFSPPTMVARS